MPTPDDVDAFIAALAPLTGEPDSDEPGPVRRRPGTAGVFEQRVRVARQVSEFVEIDPAPEVLWAGSAVTGASVADGTLVAIPLTRAPGTITVTTDLTRPVQRSRSRRLDRPDVHRHTEALHEILGESPAGTPATDARIEPIGTLEEGLVRFGLNRLPPAWEIDATAHSTVLGLFSQTSHQVAFTPDGPRFFTGDVTLHEIRTHAGPGSPPCYLSTVAYGHMVLVLAEGAATGTRIRAALSAAWRAAVGPRTGLTNGHRDTLSRVTITAAPVRADPADDLASWFRDWLWANGNRPAAPLRYTVRHMAAPGDPVRVTRIAEPVRALGDGDYRAAKATWTGSVARTRRPGPGSTPR
ncbi:hypothetical protein [Actinoplanes flavus]|uniref:Uncharacterized protein n=1 Tax=Actinoplanes flavus TaxID=2820290 RepID=A0ABS3UN06_9ACTN|nr:hypothetical protein [Actinoplanes flavus]MBO3740152.1 hypothetical protein [Actinoplanes flavus]